MEFTIRTLVAVVIILVVFAVAVALIVGWGQQENSIINGITTFFQNMLSTKTIPTGLPSLPVK